MKTGTNFFITGAVLNFIIAALHIIIIFQGAEGYRYYGAGEDMAQLDEAGSPIPALVTSLVTVFFMIFGIYGLSAAVKLKRLPFLKGVVIIIAAIFVIRGLGFVADLYMIQNDPAYPTRMVYFSLVALMVGACYTIGITRNWRTL